MPPLGDSSHSAIPRRMARLPTKTPAAPRRAHETPFGKILPVFDGFDLAETSDWLDPSTPGPSRLHNITLRTPGRRRTPAVYPSLPEVPDTSVDDSRHEPRRVSAVRNLGQENDMFTRRITDSARRKIRTPLPTEVVPTPPALEATTGDRDRSVSIVSEHRAVPEDRSFAARHSSPIHKLPTVHDVPAVHLEPASTPSAPSSIARDVASPYTILPEQRQSTSPGVPPHQPPASVPVQRKSDTSFRQPLGGRRTVVAIGSGGKTITRAERARIAGGSSTLRASFYQEKSVAYATPRPPAPPPMQTPGNVSSTTAPPPSIPRDATPAATAMSHESSARPTSQSRTLSPPGSTSVHVPSTHTPSQQTQLDADFGKTPRRYASPALSEATLNGQPEDWDASMAASMSVGNSSILSLASSRRESIGTARTRSRLSMTSGSTATVTPARPPTALSDTSSSSRRASGGVLGFLSSFIGGSPAVDPQELPPAELEEQEQPRLGEVTAEQSTSEERESQPLSAPAIETFSTTAEPASKPPVSTSKAVANTSRSTPRKQSKQSQRGGVHTSHGAISSPRPVVARDTASARPALGPARSANLPAAHTAPPRKRKGPPSPVKSTNTVLQHKRRAPPSPVKPSKSQTARPRPQGTSTFAAQALARLPKPGQGHTATVAKTTIRDAERARDLAVRRAVFERVGKSDENTAILPPSRPRVTEPMRGHIPGAASRRRAEERAAFDAEVAQRAAARAAAQAELDRVRAEIEAQMDRRARQENIIRARPLPAMYNRRQL